MTKRKENAVKQHNASARYALLDELRGLDLVSMMLYHGCWDLVNLFGIQADWYYGLPGHLWQQSICWVFILLSGFLAANRCKIWWLRKPFTTKILLPIDF